MTTVETEFRDRMMKEIRTDSEKNRGKMYMQIPFEEIIKEYGGEGDSIAF